MINPPYRFDPFQMPVNINWGGGKGTFVVADVGNYAQPNLSGISFLYPPPNYGKNYLGGYNVYSSADGINWTIQKQGIETRDPSSYWTTTPVQAGYTMNVIATIATAVDVVPPGPGGVPVWPPPDPPHSPGSFYQTPPYVAATLDGSGTSPLPPDGGGTIHTPWPSVPSPPLWPLQSPMPGQTNWPSKYGFASSYAGVVTVIGEFHYTYEMGQIFEGWNQTPGPVLALDGLSEFAISSSDPLKVFVIGGNAYDVATSNQAIPFYYRSNDGVTWTQFTPPINPTVPWIPSPSDCFFDDGSQRTMNTHPGSFDGTPTKLWFSFKTYAGPLYESSDGCVTWAVSSHYKAGTNPSTNNTDDVYVGDPNNASFFYGEINTVFGEVGGPHGVRMGVHVASDSDQGLIHSGPATAAPSTWPARTLPTPQNVVNLAAQGSVTDTVAYTVGVSNTVNDLAPAQNQLAALNLVIANPAPDSTPFMDIWTYVRDLHASPLITGIEAAIAALPAAPTPRTTTLRPFYVAYAVPPGASEGIFVAVGVGATRDWRGVARVDQVPCFWYSKDAVTWFVGNYDINFTSDTFNVTAPEYLVAGNLADQLFPVTP